jgi:60 kDa SS-A/Ro ribonucleoprotein
MSIYARHASNRITPQSQPIPGSGQVRNSAGGYAFAADDWTRLERFLILGCESGTYYATERKLAVENAECVRRCLALDPGRTVETIASISESGRAPKNTPAIFALAVAATTHLPTIAPADALARTCRTGTHLFEFVAAVKSLRGFGPGLRRLIGNWYAAKDAEAVAFQVTKYGQRSGWSHRDVLRKVNPASPTPSHAALYRWIVAGRGGLAARDVDRKGKVTYYEGHDPEALPRLARAFDATKAAAGKAEVLKLIREEHIPREFLEGPHSGLLNDPEIWEALLEKMPLTAMVRNLGKMTAIGLAKPMGQATSTIVARLADAESIRRSRLHPLAVLIASRTYASGHGLKGSLSWSPVAQIVDALDGAFYSAFANVRPANKRTLLALDISGSMDGSTIAGTRLTAREGSGAMAMVAARTEPAYHAVGFSTSLIPLPLTRTQSLRDVIASISGLPFGGTDCAQPMLYALGERLEVDTFVVYTDSETWAGGIHPVQALRQYREKTGIPAKLIVVGMTATQFSIADPSDAGMLDVVGFDAAAPSVMSDFSRGGPAEAGVDDREAED